MERLDQERDLARRRERKQFAGEDVDEATAEVADVDPDQDVVAQAATIVTATKKASSSSSEAAGPLDAKIVVHKRTAATAAATDTLDRVKQATSAIHSRLNKTGQLRTGVPIDNKGPDAGAYHATLEINDFPRKSTFRPHFVLVLH